MNIADDGAFNDGYKQGKIDAVVRGEDSGTIGTRRLDLPAQCATILFGQ